LNNLAAPFWSVVATPPFHEVVAMGGAASAVPARRRLTVPHFDDLVLVGVIGGIAGDGPHYEPYDEYESKDGAQNDTSNSARLGIRRLSSIGGREYNTNV